jgi:hypothetical protein
MKNVLTGINLHKYIFLENLLLYTVAQYISTINNKNNLHKKMNKNLLYFKNNFIEEFIHTLF